MNLDYTYLSMNIQGKDTIPFQDLDFISSNKYGIETYEIKSSHKKATLKYYTNTGVLTIHVNLPYFLNGHNFRTTSSDIHNGVELISNVLHTDINQFEVKAFEFGNSTEIEMNPKPILRSHFETSQYKLTTHPLGKEYKGKGHILKLYNQSRRIQQNVDMAVRKAIELEREYDFKGHYVKVEMKYLDTLRYFKRLLTLGDIQEKSFLTHCKNDLIQKYSAIPKMNGTMINETPSTAQTLINLMLKMQPQLGCKLIDLYKMDLKEYPPEFMNAGVRKNRVRQVKKLINDVQVNESQYDLAKYLELAEII